MSIRELSPAAYHAFKALELRKNCGRYAASQYARKHGVSSLYRLAQQLEAAGNV